LLKYRGIDLGGGTADRAAIYGVEVTIISDVLAKFLLVRCGTVYDAITVFSIKSDSAAANTEARRQSGTESGSGYSSALGLGPPTFASAEI